MSKNVLVGGAVLILALVGGGAFYVDSEVKKQADNFAVSLNKLADYWGDGFSQTHKQEKAFWSFSGDYDLKLKDEGSLTDVLNASYTVKPTVMSIFTGKYPVTLDLSFNFKDSINASLTNPSAPFYKFNGEMSSGGSFYLNGVGQDLKIVSDKSETEMQVQGNTAVITYDKLSKVLTVNSNVKKITDEQAGEEFNDLVLAYELVGSEDRKEDAHKLQLTLRNAKQGYAEFENVLVSLDGNVKNNALHSGIQLKVDKISSVLLPNKEFSFDFKAGLDDVDASLYYKLMEIVDSEEPEMQTAKMQQDALTLLKGIVDSGFTIKIEKLNVSDGSGELKSEFLLNLAKKTESKKFSDRTKLGSQVYLKSDMLAAAHSVIPPELRDLMKKDGKYYEINLDFSYLDGKALLNNKPLAIEYQEYITSFLNDLELELNAAYEEEMTKLQTEQEFVKSFEKALEGAVAEK